jgi:hypothetical protein
VYVPGAPPSARDRADAAKRSLRRRERGLRQAVARFVARRTDHQLERAPVGPLVVWALPFALRAQFRPDCAVDFDGSDIDTLMLLSLERDGGRRRYRFEIRIAEGRCRVRRRREGGPRPDATLTGSLADLIRMASASVHPLALIAEERFSMAGDTSVLVRFPAMFRQPTSSVI